MFKFSSSTLLVILALASSAASAYTSSTGEQTYSNYDELGAGACLSKHLEYAVCGDSADALLMMEATAWCYSEEGRESMAVHGAAGLPETSTNKATEIMFNLTATHDYMAICIAVYAGWCDDDGHGCRDIVHSHSSLVSQMENYAVSAKRNLLDPSAAAEMCMEQADAIDKVHVWDIIFGQKWCKADWAPWTKAAEEDEDEEEAVTAGRIDLPIPLFYPRDIPPAVVDHAQMLHFLNCMFAQFKGTCAMMIQQIVMEQVDLE